MTMATTTRALAVGLALFCLLLAVAAGHRDLLADRRCRRDSECPAGSVCKEKKCVVSCGKAGQACCAGSRCKEDNLACDAATNQCVVPPCGGLDQRCCHKGHDDDRDDDDGNRGWGAPACSSDNLVCRGGSCKACGEPGQPCCADHACNDASTAVCGEDHICQLCGAAGEACCAGSTCADGTLVCDGDDVCAPCGADGEVCCANSTCDDDTLECGAANTCAPVYGGR